MDRFAHILGEIRLFYAEIYRDIRNWPWLGLWFAVMIATGWFLFLGENRLLSVNVNQAAFDYDQDSKVCIGYATTDCQAWLAQLDQERRRIEVAKGSCTDADQCSSRAAVATESLIKPAPCEANGGCSTDKAAWQKTKVCPRSEVLWSRAETGVIRRLILSKSPALTCPVGTNLSARFDLRELGLGGLIPFIMFALFSLVFSVTFVVVRAFFVLK